VALLVGLAGHAEAIVGDRMGDIGLDGSLRTITGASYNYEYWLTFPGDSQPTALFPSNTDGFSQSVLRLELGGEPASWLKYEVHGLQDLNLTTSGEFLGEEIFGLGSTSRYRAWDGAWRWGNAKLFVADDADTNLQHVRARMWLDRLNLKFTLPWFDVTVGRQAITFGKAYFWNPLDVFLAFDPRSFDRDYKPGVDALRIDIPIGDFSGVNLVGVAGRTDDSEDFGATWRGSAVLARAYTTMWDWDFSVQGGKIYGGYQVGAAASGELGPLAVRIEGAYFFAIDNDLLDDNFVGVLGLGHTFESELNIQAEYLFNGSGDAHDWNTALLRVGDGRSYHMGEHLFGLMIDYPLLPILRGTIAWIFSFSDYSSLIQPGLALSVSDEADFVFGAMIALGARPTNGAIDFYDNTIGIESEFGTYPNFYYMEFKFYF